MFVSFMLICFVKLLFVSFSLCIFLMYIIYFFSNLCVFFFFKQKTAYERRISDWSSDVCSSDLAAITPRTRAIVAVSLYGQCADFDAINAIADRYGITVIEDAAQSFGATYRGRRSCALSTIATTSFFPSKPLGCYGDGGALFTADAKLARSLRRIARHGQDGRYNHVVVGINSRLDTVQAAVLLAKMAIFEEEIDLRQRVADGYAAEFARAGLDLAPKVREGNTSVWAQYTVRVPKRADVQATLSAASIDRKSTRLNSSH